MTSSLRKRGYTSYIVNPSAGDFVDVSFISLFGFLARFVCRSLSVEFFVLLVSFSKHFLTPLNPKVRARHVAIAIAARNKAARAPM